MATKKKASKKTTKKKPTKKTKQGKAAGGCVDLRINDDGTTTPKKIAVNDGGCVTFHTPEGSSADITLNIQIFAGGGGPIIIHS